MPYQSETIITILNRLNQQYFLPAIQREYVWKPIQLIMLFDSLMRGYPISSFLFWELNQENRDKWEVYKFAEIATTPRTGHARLPSTDGLQNLTLVIDGQQRLTSLFIGLKGSYKIRKPRQWARPENYPEYRLYLNLLQDPTPTEDSQEFTGKQYYGFRLLHTPPVNSSTEHWLRAGKILDCINDDAFDNLKDEELEKLPYNATRESRKLVERNLTRFRDMVWKDVAISFYVEREQDHDRVLDIFVRANVSGTPLNKSQILMSMLTSQWHRDAKAEIGGLLHYVNEGLSRRNNLNQDIVLRTCLVLCDLPVRYRINNFTNQAVSLIEKNWDPVKEALVRAFRLINSFRIDGKNLTSLNAVIPLALFLFHHHYMDYLGSTAAEVRNARLMQRWLVMVLLNSVFGRSTDQLLTNFRHVLNDHRFEPDFPYSALNTELTRMGIYSEEGAIQRFKNARYPSAFLPLSLVYEHQLWGITSHQQDHIFPKSLFDSSNPDYQALSPENRQKYAELAERIGNIQLLADHENNEKRARPFDSWIQTRDQGFVKQHFIPEDKTLWTLNHFEEFVLAREELLTSRLRAILR